MPEGEISLHESSVLLIPQGEQQNQTPLFTSINKFKSLSMWSNNFLKKSWTHEENVGVSDNKSEFGWAKFSKIKSVHQEHSVVPQTPHDQRKPENRFSDTSRRMWGSESRASSTSGTATCVEAEAYMAALLAQRLFKAKYHLVPQ